MREEGILGGGGKGGLVPQGRLGRKLTAHYRLPVALLHAGLKHWQVSLPKVPRANRGIKVCAGVGDGLNVVAACNQNGGCAGE